MGIEATTFEANKALRSIVHRDTKRATGNLPLAPNQRITKLKDNWLYLGDKTSTPCKGCGELSLLHDPAEGRRDPESLESTLPLYAPIVGVKP